MKIYHENTVKERLSINANLELAYNALKQVVNPNRIIYIAPYGANNYNLTDEQSDADFKAIVIPSLDDVIFERKPISTVIDYENGQIDIKDIRSIVSCWRKMNPQFLEILFAEYFFINPLYDGRFEEILNIKEKIVLANIPNALKAIYGMIQEKNNALTHPYPIQKELIDKYGFAGKQLHHILRMKKISDWYLDKNESYFNMLRYNPNEDFTKELIKLKRNKENSIANDLDTALDVAAATTEYVKNKIDNMLKDENMTQVDIETMKQLEEVKFKILQFGLRHEVLHDSYFTEN